MTVKKRRRITMEIALAEAKKCTTRTEFAIKHSGSWRYLSKRFLLDDACQHMTGNTIWNYALASKEAKKYKCKKDFKIGSHRAYQHCSRNGILSEVCSHMRKNIYWTPELVTLEAKKYQHRGQFHKGCGSAYQYCLDHDLLDEVCGHMTCGKRYTPPKNGQPAGRKPNLQAKREKALRELLCVHKWSKPRRNQHGINSTCSKCGKKRTTK